MIQQWSVLAMATLMLAALSWAAPQQSFLLPTPVPSCKRWCNHDVDGYLYCCQEEQGAGAHSGTCPDTPIQPQEQNVLDTQGGGALHCERDGDCTKNQKCCYTKFRQQRICRDV
ncbi:crustin type I [Penaeus vannamei]|uniref:Crustin type I n=1 Tax=Penaeus vannamei TaxID=6689 RepID=A0A3R7M8J5_PENVA|nr:uncharacterized protein LOC113814028 [Penaeus vannamei]XP_027221902.1 uncharacterized protein LOC113814028 [Penaeus vannamei]QOL09950.1 type Ia crustin cruIa-9 [Penaeus vannamei]ROT69980.1 crustin type I [Penaeus vannamei]